MALTLVARGRDLMVGVMDWMSFIPELPEKKNSQGISPVKMAEDNGVAIRVLGSSCRAYPAVAYAGGCCLLTARSRTPEI